MPVIPAPTTRTSTSGASGRGSESVVMRILGGVGPARHADRDIVPTGKYTSGTDGAGSRQDGHHGSEAFAPGGALWHRGPGPDPEGALLRSRLLSKLSLIHISEPTRQAEISYA